MSTDTALGSRHRGMCVLWSSLGGKVCSSVHVRVRLTVLHLAIGAGPRAPRSLQKYGCPDLSRSRVGLSAGTLRVPYASQPGLRACHCPKVWRAIPASAATWQIGRPESTRSHSRRRPSGVNGALGWDTDESFRSQACLLGRYTAHPEDSSHIKPTRLSPTSRCRTASGLLSSGRRVSGRGGGASWSAAVRVFLCERPGAVTCPPGPSASQRHTVPSTRVSPRGRVMCGRRPFRMPPPAATHRSVRREGGQEVAASGRARERTGSSVDHAGRAAICLPRSTPLSTIHSWRGSSVSSSAASASSAPA